MDKSGIYRSFDQLSDEEKMYVAAIRRPTTEEMEQLKADIAQGYLKRGKTTQARNPNDTKL